MTNQPTDRANDVSSTPRVDGLTAVAVAATSGYAIIGGTITLIGWIFNLRRLTDWRDDGISMLVNTAIAAILCGTALLLLASQHRPGRRHAARGVAALVAAIGGLTLLEHIANVDLGIDALLLYRTWGQDATVALMRMGPPASASYFLLGAVLLLATFGRRERCIASGLAVLPLAIASLSLTGYWFGVDQLFGVAQYTGIAWQTSTILAALGLGALAAIPEHGVTALLRRDDAGGEAFRQLVLPIVAIPFALGWLCVLGVAAGYYGVAFGAAMLTLVEVAMFLFLLWWTTLRISRIATAAQEAQIRLAAIVESTDDAVVSKTLDGVIESWNAGAVRLFGYSQAEAVGRSIMLIIPPDRREEEREILRLLRKGERVEDFETVRVRKDGTRIDVSLTVSPLRDAQGRIVGASKIARDVTQRKRAEATMRRNEAELRSLADSIPQQAWMARPDGYVFWFNRRWYEYTGMSPEAMEGWGWRSVHDPKILPDVMERWKYSLETGSAFEMEFPLRGADGVYRWFLARANPHRDENGDIVRWFGSNTDVDKAKHVETQLREQAHMLKLLNDAATMVGSTLELQDLLQSITDVATELSDAQFGAFFYKTRDDNGDAYLLYTLSGAPREAFEKFGNPRLTPLFRPTFEGKGIIRSDDVLKDPRYGKMAPHFGMPEGHLPVRSYLAVPVASHTGAVVGGMFFGHAEPNVFREQSERIIAGVASQASVAIDNAQMYEDLKHAADERLRLLDAERAARSEAERINLMKDEFLATLSHELRTPLSAILGWSQILRLGESDEDEVAEGLEAIERNARAQTQLIEDLLDMSRIISGKVRLDVQSINLADVLRQAVDSVRLSAEAKHIRLSTRIDPEAGLASGDPARLQQVFWNLLSNAIKFTPKGGAVDVTLQRVDLHVEVVVRDTGIGIKPEFLAHVFDRFRQADASATRSYGGLGLGLSIVKNLVELHGGAVRADSPGEGQGAEFVVDLPLSQIPDRQVRPHPATSATSVDRFDDVRLTGVKVLVVDDEPDARALLKRLLTHSQAEVTTACNADEGLESIRAERPDLIVSDIAMPGKDGRQFLREVRRMESAEGERIPAVALSAFARSEDRTKAMLAGYQVHVAKPVQPHELIATCRSLIDGTRKH